MASIIVGILIYQYLNKKKSQGPPSDSNGSVPQSKTSTKVLKTLVDANEKYMLPLIEKQEISHDTCRFRFGLPTKDHVLGLPVGQHIHLIATIADELVIRAYTPVSCDDDMGHVDLVIKVYRRNVNPKFPNGGKMSQHLDEMKIGDKIAFRGPSGKLQYLGQGKFQIRKLRKDPPVTIAATKLNMIAGGTGITPMLQLVREVLKRSDDSTVMSLLFANQTESDILLRDELDSYAAKYSKRFKVWYTLDVTTDGKSALLKTFFNTFSNSLLLLIFSGWNYSKGFINDEMIKDHLFPPSADTVVLMCGPPPMINFACQPSLEKLGYSVESRFAY